MVTAVKTRKQKPVPVMTSTPIKGKQHSDFLSSTSLHSESGDGSFYLPGKEELVMDTSAETLDASFDRYLFFF